MCLTLGMIRSTFGPTMTFSDQMLVGNWGNYVATPAAPSAEQWCMRSDALKGVPGDTTDRVGPPGLAVGGPSGIRAALRSARIVLTRAHQ